MKKETDLPEEKKQAIRPEELRLNNLVAIDNPTHWPDLKGKPMSVTCIELVSERDFPDSSASIGLIGENRKTYSQFNEFIKPIELSPEWLERLGFERKQIYESVDEYSLPGNYKFRIQTDGDVFGLPGGNALTDDLELKHVHQLMNLYFALTGQELRGVC